MQSAELINRYVNAVGENLPKKSRADIQAELKSLLTETLDARAESEGRPVDQTMTVAVLREFGDPGEVAQRYVPSHPLIGPAYFPIFSTVVKIVLAVRVVLWLVGIAFAIANSDGSRTVAEIIWQNGWTFAGELLANFGLIVIIFAVMERFLPQPPPTGEPWDPVKLPVVQNPNRVDRADAIFTIVGSVVILILLNLRPNIMPSFISPDGGWQLYSLFGPGFYQYLPLINLSCVMEIVLYSYVLFRGTWTRVTRVLEIATGGIFSAFIIVALLVEQQPISAIPALEPLVELGLAAALVVVLVNVGLNIYRLITKRWSPPSSPELELASNGQHS